MQGATFYGNTLQAPRWAADFLDREHLEPWSALVDPTQFTDSAGVPVTVTASAIATATSITVTALTPSLFPATTIIASGNVLIKSGSVLSFGSGKFAQLTADAKVGDTTLTVAALPTALAGNETTVFSIYGSETIASGTVIGRTFAMRNSSALWRPALVTDDEIFLVAFDIPNAKLANNATLYRHNSRVRENYLPNFTSVLNAAANEVQTLGFTNSPAGTFVLRIKDSAGVMQETPAITYSGTAATLVSNIQAGINTVIPQVASTNQIVVSGSAVTAIALTFSGTGAGYAGVAQKIVDVDTDALTAGAVSVASTTPGGTAMLTKIRSLYQCILGVD